MTTDLQSNAHFGAAFMSQMQNLDVRKPYQVFPLSGRVRKTVNVIEPGPSKKMANGKEKSTYRHVKKEVVEPAGFLVKFPYGHSIRVRTKEELERLGFHLEPGLVSMMTGDILMPNRSVQEMQTKIDLVSLLPPGYEDMPAGEAVKLGDKLPGKTAKEKEV